MGRITETVKVLIIVNVIFFIGSLTLQGTSFSLFAFWFPYNDNFHFWQILTYMFMHSHQGISHIFFNMLLLFLLGSDLEYRIGQKKFLFLYFSAGFGALALQLLFYYLYFIPGYQAFIDAGFVKNEILEFMREERYNTAVLQFTDQDTVTNMYRSYYSHMVGASGAVSGVIAAFGILFWNEKIYLLFIPFPIKAKYLMLLYFVPDIMGAITSTSFYGVSNIAHWAHIGGAVIGFITMWYWKKNSFNQHRWY
ncbi:rhomboid family intramembrane serine protease [Aquimarina sp. MMG016]|uniref:rhomboid family intramembrane serine protease n=1 Tax=Aquimarina sp. MMG016 TaxID=2822690 RepID=UPI001B39D430|nr:rhomboid family intramembrane serine protease [Aquimarina sp. MMG016]MBQ4822690.1 rhomboid family intramembrane serine protease [Aquimarina sp. MMG016]